MRTRGGVLAGAVAVGLFAPVVLTARAETTPACASGADPVTFVVAAAPADARSYRLLPFDVAAGTTVLRVEYSWADGAGPPSTPLTSTTFDLGLWQGLQPSGPDATFRGWSGSRQRKVSVSAASATRGYVPGPVDGGTDASRRWWVELGIAAVAPQGSTATVAVSCSDEPIGPAFAPDHVPADYAVPGTGAAGGWYFGDFHLHGRHSNPCAPGWTTPEPTGSCATFPAIADQARDAGLDILGVTDYVTTAHWGELGDAQAAAPDLLWWPAREVITYFGHATVFGETTTVDHRHGFSSPGGAVTIGAIQAAAKADGALFGVAHPTIFPGPVFRAFCRGCEWELGDDIDWTQVDTIEVHTGPALAALSDIDGRLPSSPSSQQPFDLTAIDLWEDLLRRGYKIAPVSGSDSKGVEPNASERERRGYGSSATAIRVDGPLTVANVREAIRAGRTYVATRGANGSPRLDLVVRSTDGDAIGTFGSVVPADQARMDVHVTGAKGQLLRVSRDGDPVALIPITSDDWHHQVPVFRLAAADAATGAPWTFWRVDTLDARSVTTIGNAVFLTGA